MAEEKGSFIQTLEDLTGYVAASAKYGLTLIAIGGGFYVTVVVAQAAVDFVGGIF